MASEQLRAVSAQIRAQNAVHPTGTGSVAEMRASMEAQQGQLALPADVTWVDGPGLAVSATDVRRRVKEGRSVRFLVPDAVADYLAKRRLYR